MPADTFPSALLYFTGSDLFNVRMRMVAIEKGLMLNEFGLWRKPGAGGSPPASPSKAGARRSRSRSRSVDVDDGDASDGEGVLRGESATGVHPVHGKRVPCRTEREIFDALGMEFVEPSKRTS
jgi:DNA polymerase/3'-5' exonuclease PolX